MRHCHSSRDITKNINNSAARISIVSMIILMHAATYAANGANAARPPYDPT